MTVYGDLETSTLTELPAGRSAIATHVVPAADKPHFLERTWERVGRRSTRGRQAYVVCPRIGDGNRFRHRSRRGGVRRRGHGRLHPARHRRDRPAAAAGGPRRGRDAGRGPLAGLRLGILPAGCTRRRRNRVMREFSAGEIDVLVATTVIEVGRGTCRTPP